MKNIKTFYYALSFAINYIWVIFNLIFKDYFDKFLINLNFKVFISIFLKNINSNFKIIFLFIMTFKICKLTIFREIYKKINKKFLI